MKVKVKICGVRNLESAEAAITAGADFIGLNFVPTSKRYIDPKNAEEIIKQIRGQISIVGIFQNTSVDEVNEIGDMLDLDFVQLHGEEDEEYMKKINRKIIKSVAIESSLSQNGLVEYLLLDRKVQGKGDIVDLEKGAEISSKFPTFFSGGLTPENVSGVVRKVKPFAVDVAGGVETNGQQDLEKIKKFIYNAKEEIV